MARNGVRVWTTTRFCSFILAFQNPLPPVTKSRFSKQRWSHTHLDRRIPLQQEATKVFDRTTRYYDGATFVGPEPEGVTRSQRHRWRSGILSLKGAICRHWNEFRRRWTHLLINDKQTRASEIQFEFAYPAIVKMTRFQRKASHKPFQADIKCSANVLCTERKDGYEDRDD